VARRRELIIECFSSGTSGCCGIDELYGFLEDLGPRSKPPTDDEWLSCFSQVLYNEDQGLSFGPIILFSGNEQQGRYKFSPQALAAWLSQQGEKVAVSEIVKNNNSGQMIQAFLWTVSNDFRVRLTEFRDKENNKNNATRSRANVA